MSGFIEARPRVGYFYTGKSKNKIINEKLRKYVVKDYMSHPVVIKEKFEVIGRISKTTITKLFVSLFKE